RDVTDNNITGTEITLGTQTPTDTPGTIDYLTGGTLTGFPTPPTGDAHQHDLNHYHQISHTHGDIELPQHVHGVQHTHTVPAHEHDLTHDHSSPQHVHPLPELTESFGLERVAALDSYVMADLEYSVNGGSWTG